MPRPGETVHVGRPASVQFDAGRDFNFRIIRVEVDGHTPTGWAHLVGYQLDRFGQASVSRTVFVEVAGLRPPKPFEKPPVKPVNRTPSIPAQRAARTTARSPR